MAGRLNVIWDRTLLGVSEDVAINTFHLDGSMTQAAIDAFATRWLANWAQIQARISNKYKVDRVVGYAETPGPNPPVGEADLNVLGSATSNPLPPQVSLTVTERTNLRRNWGRIYIPGIASVHLTDVGRFSDANCIVFADWAQDMFAPYTVAPLHVNVVYSRADQSEHDILKVQVDDLFDVQRRRRYRAPAIREERTV